MIMEEPSEELYEKQKRRENYLALSCTDAYKKIRKYILKYSSATIRIPATTLRNFQAIRDQMEVTN